MDCVPQRLSCTSPSFSRLHQSRRSSEPDLQLPHGHRRPLQALRLSVGSNRHKWTLVPRNAAEHGVNNLGQAPKNCPPAQSGRRKWGLSRVSA
eukprot:5220637-Amphidinium_carterae.2